MGRCVTIGIQQILRSTTYFHPLSLLSFVTFCSLISLPPGLFTNTHILTTPLFLPLPPFMSVSIYIFLSLLFYNYTPLLYVVVHFFPFSLSTLVDSVFKISYNVSNHTYLSFHTSSLQFHFIFQCFSLCVIEILNI